MNWPFVTVMLLQDTGEGVQRNERAKTGVLAVRKQRTKII